MKLHTNNKTNIIVIKAPDVEIKEQILKLKNGSKVLIRKPFSMLRGVHFEHLIIDFDPDDYYKTEVEKYKFECWENNMINSLIPPRK